MTAMATSLVRASSVRQSDRDLAKYKVQSNCLLTLQAVANRKISPCCHEVIAEEILWKNKCEISKYADGIYKHDDEL